MLQPEWTWAHWERLTETTNQSEAEKRDLGRIRMGFSYKKEEKLL